MPLVFLALYITVAVLICFASADGPTTASPVGGHRGTTQSKIHNTSMPMSGSAKRNNDLNPNVPQRVAGQHRQGRKPKDIQKQQATLTRSPAMSTPAAIDRTRSPTMRTRPASTIRSEWEKRARRKHRQSTRRATTVSTRSTTVALKRKSSPRTTASTRKNVISSTEPSTTRTTKTTQAPSPVPPPVSIRPSVPPRGIGRFRACDKPCVCACEKAACERLVCSTLEKCDQDECSLRCWDVCFDECAKTGLRP